MENTEDVPSQLKNIGNAHSFSNIITYKQFNTLHHLFCNVLIRLYCYCSNTVQFLEGVATVLLTAEIKT